MRGGGGGAASFSKRLPQQQQASHSVCLSFITVQAYTLPSEGQNSESVEPHELATLQKIWGSS
jgi:hypothetical protein